MTKFVIPLPYSAILSQDEKSNIRSSILNTTKHLYNAYMLHGEKELKFTSYLETVFNFIFDKTKVYTVPHPDDNDPENCNLNCSSYITTKFRILEQAINLFEQQFYSFTDFSNAITTIEDYFIGSIEEEFEETVEYLDNLMIEEDFGKIIDYLSDEVNLDNHGWSSMETMANTLDMSVSYILVLLKDVDMFKLTNDYSQVKYVE